MHGALSIAVIGFIQDAFGDVVFGAVAFSLLMSLLILLTRHHDSAYDQIGSGGISREGDYGGAGPEALAGSAADRAERELEIRQMLSARSERLVRRGEPALDVDAELARLLAGEQADATRDPGLLAEVRQLVVARNERRIRQGLEPLDVDSEVTRTLEELGS